VVGVGALIALALPARRPVSAPADAPAPVVEPAPAAA
jgi:hypothetical protein